MCHNKLLFLLLGSWDGGIDTHRLLKAEEKIKKTKRIGVVGSTHPRPTAERPAPIEGPGSKGKGPECGLEFGLG